MKHATFSFSVDDGHPLDLRMADLLLRHELAATFYVPMRNREGPPVLQAAQLRQLAKDFEIGSHTRDHQFLNQVPADLARRQIVDGKAALEDQLGCAVAGFCYPGGQYRALHCRMVQQAGFRYARTTQNLRLDASEHPFELPVSLQFYPHSRQVLLRNFLSGRHWLKRQAAWRICAAEADWLERLYRLFDHAVQTKSLFHLWCHSRDIDRLQLWQPLDEFLGLVAHHIPARRRVDNAALVEQNLVWQGQR